MSIQDRVQLFIAGDSTAASYPANRAPLAGWGQAMQVFFSSQVIVRNEAASGRSTKSFIAEHRLKPMEDEMTEGDYLLIQFGHNDSKADLNRHTDPFTSYQSNLKIFIELARHKGAFPVLITPVERRLFNSETGELNESHGEYPEAVKQLAAELQVPLIDLCSLSQALYRRLGAEEAKRLFNWLEPGEHPNYPQGTKDNTHFNEHGAAEIAGLVVQEIKRLDLGLHKYLL